MIKIESNKENNTHRILLRPNRSTSWRLSLFFIGFIAVTCLSIGIAFAFLGATLILPFAGLEVLFVSICVYLVLRNSYRQEVIIMTQDKLRIESGIATQQGRFQEQSQMQVFPQSQKKEVIEYESQIPMRDEREEN